MADTMTDFCGAFGRRNRFGPASQARPGRRRIQPVESLLERQMPVEVVAPVAGGALDPFALDEPAQPQYHHRPPGARQRQRFLQVYAGDQEEGDVAARIRLQALPSAAKLHRLDADPVHLSLPYLVPDDRRGPRERG